MKDALLLIEKSNPCSGGTDFLSRYLGGPLPYGRRHITVNKNVFSTSFNKTFPSFLSHSLTDAMSVVYETDVLKRNIKPIYSSRIKNVRIKLNSNIATTLNITIIIVCPFIYF